MKFHISFLLSFLWVFSIPHGFGQLTINITSVPAATPENATIFIAGNFNSWNPGDPVYQLTETGNDQYSITFTPSTNNLEFKFTRGSWATVEGNAQGGFLPNRSYTYNGQASTLNVTIAGWEGGGFELPENVQILDDDFNIPQLNRTRRIWAYTPPDYDSSSKHYPVIYMHDGQNLFTDATSFAGEWKIDESLNQLQGEGDYGAIVIGIDNGGASRFDEYCPWVNPTYGGGEGEAYMDFIVQTLKPHIDSTFRTLPGREYTAIAGSSMGGLISMYAVAEYPEVFSKAGIFSPAFWVADSIFQFIEQQEFTEQVRVYFVASHNESASMVPLMEEVYDLMQSEGITTENLLLLDEADGAHSEWFWAREFPDAYEWLFEDLALSAISPQQKKSKIYPNPVENELAMEGVAEGTFYTIYSIMGNRIQSGTMNGKMNVSRLSPGSYLLKYTEKNNAPNSVLFVKH